MKKIKKFETFICIVIILKIIAMGVFSSDYQNIMFMRFIYGFIDKLKNGILTNPYSIFQNELNLFPYPPIMFIIELIGGLLSKNIKNIIIRNILFKIPSLIFDILGLYFLMKMFPNRRKYIGILYFASPIIFYSIYMHGQLDIIPTVFLIGSIYFLITKRNELMFSVMLALSLMTKFHILAVVPLFALYIQKKRGWLKAIKLLGLTFVISFMIIFPFFDKNGNFLRMVIMNKEQNGITNIFIQYKNTKVYLSILAIMCIYLKAFSIKKINKNLLYSLCGILFSIFLILVLPMPGWYVWIVPFTAMFFINIKTDKYININIYVLLNILYLIYFILIHKTEFTSLYFLNYNFEFFKIKNPTVINTIFTILTASLSYISYMMYQLGITNNLLYKRKNNSFSIGISGDSGSGKSTLIEKIKNIFGEKNILFLEGDGDHKWERGNEMWNHVTALNPKANYIYKQAEDLEKLRKSQYVFRVEYDHDTGKFTEEYKVKSKPYIVLCGLHSLYLPQMRKNLDLKIYMDIDENLRRYWKIQRDVNKRGYKKEKVLEAIEKRMKDAVKYIYPQKKYADLIIKYYDNTLKDYISKEHNVNLNLEVTLSADINLEEFRIELERKGINIKYDYDADLITQVVTFYGQELNQKNIKFENIIEKLIPNLDEILEQDLTYSNNIDGIIETLILIMISYKMREEVKE
ncbi:uridine kinase [Leptotrichia sp. OH3620_COT-345]|uniref:uridine kinase n=1 Tax=Leptotrichia sp. OH3620_COT-345 TaxID=2491048 RepID=UPI001F1F2DF5|nr:uridine kinase [Leptotrichia sp. OH3620_COT-345]